MTGAITDFSQYAGLRVAAENRDPAVLREVAGQFEALFVQTLLKNMREASLGDPLLGDSDQHAMYQEMLDQQLSVEMTSRKGIGLADMLVRQLGGDTAARAAPPGSSRDVGTVSRVAPRRGPQWTDPAAFAKDLWPHAERVAKRLDVAPEAVLAQAALETGWGAHVPRGRDGSSSMNLFGIKAGNSWAGAHVAKSTLEFEAGVPRLEVHKFRAYDSVAASFDDYAALLSTSPRYASVAGHGEDVGRFAAALQASGYATDPAYAAKLERVAGSETLQAIVAGLKNAPAAPTSTVGDRLVAGAD